MPQTLACPHCEGTVGVADEDLGFHVTCPHCDRDFLAPAGIAPAASAGVDPDQDDWLQLEDVPGGANQRSSRDRDDEILAQYTDSLGGLDLPDFVDNLPARPPKTTTTKTAASKTAASTSPSGMPKPAASGPPTAERETQTEYRVTCKTCGTPTYVKAKQAGRTIRCPDCHSGIKVPPPPKVPRKPAPMPEPKAMPLRETASADRKPDPYKKSAQQLLAEAEAAEVESPPPDYDNPDIGAWLKSVFGIFTDSGVLAHWLVFSMIAALPTYFAINSGEVILIGALYPYAIIVGALISACAFAVLLSVANQENGVQSWPVFEPMEWLSQLFLVSAAVAVPLIPVAAIVGAVFGASIPLLLVVGLLAVYLLFPFVLLSMMDMNSPFVPFSAEVARSVTRSQEAWGGLYFSSGILFFAFLLFVAAVTSMVGGAGMILSITAAVAVVFIYFAMIGRLAFAIGQGQSQ